MAIQILIPHNISVTFGSKEIRIESGDFSLCFDNGCTFTRFNTNTGIDVFPLEKSGVVKQTGNVSLIIPDTNDTKQKESIEYLKTCIEEVQKKDIKEIGSKSFVAAFKDSSGTQFLSISFDSYIAKLNLLYPENGNDFPRYFASFVSCNDSSFLIS